MTRPQSIERIREALEAGPKAWLIECPSNGHTAVHRHNAIGDYRQVDPDATVAELFALNPREILTYLEGVERDAAELRNALRPFANYACPPESGLCACHNCKARAAIAKEPKP